MIRVDLSTVADAIRKAAAAEVMPRFRNLKDDDVREKSPGDVVTAADDACERVLTPRLRQALPGSVVVGEEAAAADPTVLRRLAEADPVWVIDPVDGTANYAAGKPVFAVMVALIHRDETIAAWIHDPVADVTAMGETGSGARMMDGQVLTVPPAAPVADMTGWLSTKFMSEPNRSVVQGRLKRLGTTGSLFCAGHEYLALLRGERHFSVYQRTWPWDHAPGVLLHAEAGGFAAREDGEPYSPSIHHGGLMCAPSEAAWDALHRALFDPAA